MVLITELAERMSARKKILIASGIVDLGGHSAEIHTKLAEYVATVFDQVLYVGESGKKEFGAVLGERMIEGPVKIEQELRDIDAGTLIVIEGLMPGFMKDQLKKLEAN